MGDVQLFWDLARAEADFAIVDDDLASDEGLQTAVLLSFALDRRAEDSDTLPTDDGDLRGWWGDQFSENPDDKIGSRRWLLARSKLTPALLPTIEAYDRESLQWLIEDQVAASIGLEYEIEGNRLDTSIIVRRGDGTEVSVRFDHIWDGEAARGAPSALPFVWSGKFPSMALNSAGLYEYLGIDGSVSPALGNDSHIWQAEDLTGLDVGTLASSPATDMTTSLHANGINAGFGGGGRNILLADSFLDVSATPTALDVPTAQDGSKSFLVGGVIQIDSYPGADNIRPIFTSFDGTKGWFVFTRKDTGDAFKLHFRTISTGATVHTAISPVTITIGIPIAFMANVDVAAGKIKIMTSEAGSYAEDTWADVGDFDSGTAGVVVGEHSNPDWGGWAGLWAQMFSFEYSPALDAQLSADNMTQFLKFNDGYLSV